MIFRILIVKQNTHAVPEVLEIDIADK